MRNEVEGDCLLEIMQHINLFKEQQTMDGSWNYPFETGIMTDAYMIILLRPLNLHEDELI
ncbi:hypothetical protein [Halobacillus alkaliphilus]|uniref:hypothetical protein n=1 Tax=Halobacillus alkaliphilus TaxID=396056 RepID=UPI001113EFFB|nr:hypothetical protein [Halobacillus alkaliphilus]